MSDKKILYPHTKPVFVERFNLIVRDLDLVSSYYQHAIGLEKIEGGQRGHVLGAGRKPLLTLEYDPGAHPSPRRAAGLFHTAFLLPTRKDLGHFLRHVAEDQIPLIGVADHLVSEAIYLQDPEGNGIEVYADRPHQEWQFDEEGVVMDTVGLNTDALLNIAPHESWYGLPSDTAIGHIHLQVGDLPKAENFYRDVMGLDVMERFPGGTFFASGDYHHHLAANVWVSPGAQGREERMAGLKGYTLKFNDNAALLRVQQTIEDQELEVKNTLTGKAVRDPWNIELTLTT
tara:strand:+ start:1905 stop:2765 length:861 start_codon:yes stop_codon:yes gene_type:complete